MSDDGAPPEGFEKLAPRSPFVQASGTFYRREGPGGALVVGTRIGPAQANAEARAHGAFLLTLVDFALSMATYGITLNLSADFLRPARVGDWVEAHVTVRKRGETVVFADAILRVGADELMRVSGLFSPFAKKPDP
jgi:acyl-coenzyme A thioesterase PaaI-like protein